ncbi:LysR family transcriptional regulator [Acinetobacter shaoyimingii]|uniref:LysR family transcriptional regulator n=1 Tax=Acinetobacter shaoyimingii TaxID=2715164 RepID=A0A6G8RS50_9GAMM|nr:LysR family transcriptional regulator [Acinetobacter shaoyimingii]NHB56783.1 LysR family transcriptional regulator [Acinetobacter shaoyimingii]QIO04715.1 LysR family transcriptional regulator [Acinetobacter shaoyimingii]
MDKVEYLKTFCLVAEMKSFAQVAKYLGLPRSTVTYAIQSLEKEYEVLLFYRTTRKVSLTHEGELFYQEAQQLIQKLKELHRFKYQVREQKGKITVGLPKRMATQILIPRLAEFYQNHPEVKVHIKCCDEYSNLIDQQLDCVIRVGVVKDEYLIAKSLGTCRLCSVVAPSYIQFFGKPTRFEDLDQHYAVEYLIEKNQKDKSELLFLGQRLKLPHLVLVEDTESYIQAGLAGLGIIQIPEFDARFYLKQGTLIEIFKENESIQLPIHFLSPDRKFRPEYLQDFMRWFAEILQSTMDASSQNQAQPKSN